MDKTIASDAYFYRASVWFRSKLDANKATDNAIEDYTEVIRRNPKMAEAYLG
jgi:hypothetical protein